MKYDLHIHTTCSDGKYTKLQLLNYFNRCGYNLVSFADHNYIEMKSCSSINQDYFEKYAMTQKVSILEAVEFDVFENSSLHILGYDIIDKELIKNKLDYVRKINSEIALKIIIKIANHYGIDIPLEELTKSTFDGNITKSDINKWMINNRYAKNYIEAGMLYTSQYSPCYEKRYSLPMLEVISLIKKSGGLAFLAHPSTIKYSNEDLRKLINVLAQNGLDGIEINNLDKTTIEQMIFYKLLAKELKLLQSCGSDFHSEESTKKIGLEDNEIKKFVKVLQRRGVYDISR